METKVCTGCKRELAVEEFSRQSKGLYGRRAGCKVCECNKAKEKNRAYAKTNDDRDDKFARFVETKRCSKCKQVKKRYEFHRNRQTKDGYKGWCADCGRKIQQAYGYNNFSGCRSKAKSRGLTFTLTEQEYNHLVACDCTYCGGELPKAGGGLDRLDNSRGYELDNVVPCCTECNRIRGCALTHEQMLRISPQLREFRLEREAAHLSLMDSGDVWPVRDPRAVPSTAPCVLLPAFGPAFGGPASDALLARSFAAVPRLASAQASA